MFGYLSQKWWIFTSRLQASANIHLSSTPFQWIIIFIVKCCNDQLLGLKGVSKFFIKRWKSFWLKMRTTITVWVSISMSLFDCCRQYLPISTCTASPVITLHCCDIGWTNKVELHASRCTVIEILKTYGILCLETKYKSVRMETIMTAANSKKEEWALDSPCQRLRKSIKNSMENKQIDAMMQRVKGIFALIWKIFNQK